MVTIPKLSPPESLGAAIAPLATVSDTEFERLRRVVSTRRSFNVQAKVVKELLAEVPGLSANLPFMLGALTFLYGRLEPYRDKTPLPAIVTQLVEDFDVKCEASDRQRLERRLTLLLERNEAFEASKKTQRLEKGFLPNAIGFRSFVDLRPDFGGEETVSFKGFLKIVQFRIRTDAETKRAKEFVFQVNEEALDELQQAIDRAKAKLRALDQIPDVSQKFIARADK
jgi:hypothetical protein